MARSMLRIEIFGSIPQYQGSYLVVASLATSSDEESYLLRHTEHHTYDNALPSGRTFSAGREPHL